ncbi:sugar porter family MFS transporter [Marinilabilia rubra]|uniref:MFS transporter n=1 Tax=Marinilabilia rubra TaxID=2162893 RepID=A0A2U2BC12_9BACT|nr:sugar porter family MFS transporter [Marinilabilia rubra]PWE00606.1 MFS transporter [Marinilabilia rubra]
MKNKRYLYWITFVAIQGGLIFGLNMAGISGAVPLIKEYFSLSDVSLGIAVSSIMAGCLIGAMIIGGLSDKWGRKPMMILSAVLFMISAAGCALTESLWLFIVCRITAGIGVGSVSVLSPTYIAETAPAKKRGTLVTLNQFAIVIGILLAYVFDYALINFSEAWRYMMAVPFVFGIMFLVSLLFSFPESPRWLVKTGKLKQAQLILEKIGGNIYAEQELKNIKEGTLDTTGKKVKINELFKGKLAKVVFLGSMLAFFAQITGINAVLNYAPTIFSQSGLASEQAMMQSIYVGIVNFLATIFALWLVDRKGRKVLLTWGTGGMTISLAYMVYAFLGGDSGNIGILISLLAYCAFYATSLAPVLWVVTSEIYPNRIRGMAMSFSTALTWLFSFVSVQFFPLIINEFGGAFAFGFFGFFSLFAFFFIWKYIPETKGKSLEQIEKELDLI